jgi:hypothetical protein
LRLGATVQVVDDVGADDPGTARAYLPELAAVQSCLAATRALLRERGVPFVASPGDAGPAGAPIVVLGGTPESRSSLAAAVAGGPAWLWGASSPPMFVEFRFGAPRQIPEWAPPAAGWCRPRRVVVQHPAPLLEHLRVIDTPGLAGDGYGHAALHAAVQQAAGVLVVADVLPLSETELTLLKQWSQACRTAVLAVAHQPGRRAATTWLRDQLAEHVAEWADAPCVLRDNVAGLREALMSVARPAELIRACYPLRLMREAVTEEWAHLGQRLRAARGDLTGTEIEKLAERAAMAAPAKTEPSWVARPRTAAALGTAIDTLREHFDNRAHSADLAVLNGLPDQLDTALAGLAASWSANLTVRAGHSAHLAVGRRFSANEARHVAAWVLVRIRELFGFGGVPGTDGLVAVTDAPRPWPSWSNPAVVIGATEPLVVPDFDMSLSADAGHTWLRIIGDGGPAARTQRARRWLHQVLDAAHACCTAEIADRTARLDAAIDRALAEAHDRWGTRRQRQLADIRAVPADPATRGRLAATLAGERTVLEDQLRRIDAVLTRAHRVRQGDVDATAADLAPTE